MTVNLKSWRNLYRDELLERVLPFWERHSVDRRCGGFLTCLDRRGRVYDTDKFMWLQGRQVWTFSMLYNRLDKRRSWLDVARHGVAFMRKHGRDRDGNWYFALDRSGRPLIQPYNIFSDCFAAMGFAQYALAAGDDGAAAIARDTFRNILRRRENPKGRYAKGVPGTRPMKTLALPMILINLTFELEGVVPQSRLDAVAEECRKEVLALFWDRRRKLFHEAVAPDGARLDCFDGRLLNPGHGIEALWFLMDLARRRGDKAMIRTAVETLLAILETAWDREYGGLYYFLDSQGCPPDRLEWDQKLFWVHCETLVALLMGYALTGRPECLRWFEKVHRYTWAHYPDPRYGEWFGYLNRRGEVLLPLKGGKWKGCFHVPRTLFRCWRELEGLHTKFIENGTPFRDSVHP